MSRSMAADNTELFRAVVTVTYRDETPEDHPEHRPDPVRTMVEILGPYQTKGAAMAATKRADRDAQWYKRYFDQTTVVGHVERTSATWEPVQ